MTTSKKVSEYMPFLIMGGLYILVDGLALLLVNLFASNGVGAFENPDDPMNILYFFTLMLVFTGAILLIARFHKKRVLAGIFMISVGLMCFNIIYLLAGVILSDLWAFSFSVGITVMLLVLLMKYPEWYIVDICGLLLGVGSILTIGTSLSTFLVIMLLSIMAVYDAISVYKTKHMISLADTVLSLKVPVVLLVPKIRNYSLMQDTTSLNEKLQKGEERQVFLLGLGDIVFPGALVVSSYNNLASNNLFVAFGVLIGTLVGYSFLTTLVVKGKPQAGLPLLCGFAILGYFVSVFLLYGKLVF